MSRAVGVLNVDNPEFEQCAARSVKKTSRQEAGLAENSFDRNPTLSVIIAIRPTGKGSIVEEAPEEMSVGDLPSCSKTLAMFLNHQHDASKTAMKTKKRNPCLWFTLCCGRRRPVGGQLNSLHSKADGEDEYVDAFKCEPVVMPPETTDVLRWDFDVFAYEKRNPGRVLEVVFMELLDHFELIPSLNLDPGVCGKYIKAIEGGYRNNPYHNHVHAADVLQSVGVILHHDNYFRNFTNLELLALILSAAVHDVCHPGVNNDFHKKTQSDLAKKYSDSINERMHFDEAYKILEHKDYKTMLKGLSEEEFGLLKRYVYEILIATDMDRHDALVRDFGRRFSNMNGFTVRALPYSDKVLLLQMIVHCADISNPARPWQKCKEWAERITEENVQQTEKAKELNVVVAPKMDRKDVNLAKSQRFFLEKFVMPCFRTFGLVVPSFAQMTLKLAEINNQKWDEELAKPKSSREISFSQN